MDIKGLCLGVLTFGDATGYDIKKFFECTFSHFFKAGYGSIYPALAELSNEGLVSYRVDHQEGKPDRKIYHINKNGHEHFIKQLCSTPPRHSVKSEFLVLMFFAHLLPVEQLNHILVERLGDITRQLELTAERQTQMSDMNCPPGIRFATELGLAVMQAARGYIETHHKELLAAVQEVQKSPSLASTNCWQNQSKPKH